MDYNTRRNIAELGPAENIQQTFLISQPQLRTTNRGDLYIAAFLSDKTGKLNGRMWQASHEIYNSLPQEGFVWVSGRTEMYQGSLQMVINAIKPIDTADVDMAEFLPCTSKDIPTMFERLKELLKAVKNPHLQRLCQAFLADSKLMSLFCKAPAAISLHHGYIGGLLEHTLSLLESATRILPNYPDINADIVLTSLFLHDIGKTTEIDYDISFKYSTRGHLLGHLVMGAQMVQDKVNQLNANSNDKIPQLLADCIEHIIVSHHGTREFGCPVLPSTPEAYMVHFLDNLDAKMVMTINEINKDTNKSDWTNFIRVLDTPLFKKRTWED